MTQDKKTNMDMLSSESFGAQFGRLVRFRRGIEGITQQELAARAFGDPSLKSRISALESGKIRRPQQRTVDAISVALDIHPSEVSDLRSRTLKEAMDDESVAITPNLTPGNTTYGMAPDANVNQISNIGNLSLAELEQISRMNLALSLVSLGQKARDKQHISEGISHYQKALEIARNVEDKKSEILILNNLAEAFRAMADLDSSMGMHLEAIKLLQQALKISSEG